MKVTFVYSVNNSGQLRVHRSDCKDVKREAPKAATVYTIDAPSKRYAACEFHSDFLGEGSMTAEEAVYYSDFLPCTDELPDTTPAEQLVIAVAAAVAAATEAEIDPDGVRAGIAEALTAADISPQGLVLDRVDPSSGARFRLCEHGVSTIDPRLCSHQ
jgi:hypothetical protein